mmetsp:Transcript_21181/g.37722  ORF Transcript_21181/g.37722 Transcript_21181/m.37722 type:complete len:285 (-) Transcript_21181:135-989(-)|eukprot:CAMPEP_0177765802 /NCGR_PEP_ID=MMETSP0491_2-20121128/8181_1 /TAXON_ID=63592 /ORGANISM="Tetraselmis chuii, Strain PLY429" /LENGTH=284 /DNA_ID=CAMNT_0019282165 /DNA_START=128 /DNA_END=982 /DNA_ORIENTATION=-
MATTALNSFAALGTPKAVRTAVTSARARSLVPASLLVQRRNPTFTPASRPLVTRRTQRLTCRASAEYMDDSELDISKISFGSIAAPIGITLMVYGFGAYINLLPGADLSSVLLVYGFPISLIGLALKYAELKPVTCKTTKEAFELRASQMTDIQKQVREDTTRYRYGDEQHLDEALSRVFKFGRPEGLPRRQAPKLVGLREEVMEGAYTLVMEFESPKMTVEQWEKFQPKFQSFFGPGVIATLAPKEGGMDVALMCDGSGDGRGGEEKKDLLPPLMPGLKGRSQ